eukprot:328292_1
MGLCCSSSAKDADSELGENLISLEEGNGTDEILMPSNSFGWFSIRKEYWFLTAVVVVILIFAIAGGKLLSSAASRPPTTTLDTVKLQEGWQDKVLEIMKKNPHVFNIAISVGLKKSMNCVEEPHEFYTESNVSTGERLTFTLHRNSDGNCVLRSKFEIKKKPLDVF